MFQSVSQLLFKNDRRLFLKALNKTMKTTPPWWNGYRRRYYKNRNYLTIEMVLRKSFKETFKEYLSLSSVGGIKQILDSSNTKFQKFFWIVIFCVTTFFVCYFLYTTWETTFTSPFIVTDETSTYPISEIDFPAVSLCNFNRISKSASEKYAAAALKLLGSRNVTPSYTQIFMNMGRMIDYRLGEISQKVINEFPRGIMYYDMVTMMRELAPNCTQMLVKCRWAGRDVQCSKIFRIRRTGMGHCCSFNYVLKLNSADNPNGIIAPVKRQKMPGADNGLMVVIDPLIEDYAYRLGVRDGIQVLLHDPTQFPDGGGRVLYRMAQSDQAHFLQINSIKQYATSEVHKYHYLTRNCMFKNEMGNTFGDMYSSSACLVRCRIETIRSLCKCIPFYYPSGLYKDDKICTLRNLWCLNKYKEKLLYVYPFDAQDTAGLEMEVADSLYCPDCLSDCEMTQHFTKSYKVSLTNISPRGFESNFLQGVNLTNKCILNIYHPTAVGTLYRLDAVAYWFEILSNIGGFAGMLMGIGFFTFVELIYFITIRLVRSIYVNYKIYH